MAERDEMVDNNKPRVVSDKLIQQIGEIEELFSFGEKLYPYENIRHNQTELNEDSRRKQIAAGANFGPTSASSLNNAVLYGFASVYLFSRVGAKSVFDMGPLRKNVWTSAAIFMFGMSFGALYQCSQIKT